MLNPKIIFLNLIAAAIGLSAAAELENWPSWRGPTENLVAKDGQYPTTLDPKTNAVWKADLPGPGASTPCVWGDRIFVTCEIDGQDGVICYDLSGNKQWQIQLGEHRPGKHRNGSGANPSPISDGEHVYVYFKSGNLAAIDFAGNTKWKINLQQTYGEDTLWWDLGTSPVFAGDNVVVAVMHTGDSYMGAIDKATGKTSWRTPRNFQNARETDHAYTTPVVATIDGKQQIIAWGADHLTAYDFDGKLLWTCGGMNPENKPMWRVIASHAQYGHNAIVPYGRGDYLAFVKLGGEGDITDTAHVKTVGPKVGSDVTTAITVDGKAYVLTDIKGRANGTVMGYDIKTGEALWDKPFKLPRAAGTYYSSPVKAGDYFYFAHESGIIHVAREIEGGMELIHSNTIPERQLATIVPINGHILLRTEKSLYYFK